MWMNWVRFVLIVFFCFEPAHAQTKPTGVPVPEDGPLFAAFKLLESQPAYRMTVTMEPRDPRMAQMAKSMGMSPTEHVVKNGVHQVIMHWKMPAMDQPGTIDDWEIRAVVQNGRGARRFSSPAAPRILRFSEQMLAMQMEMLNRQAATAIAQAAASGPLGWVSAANIAAQTAIGDAMAARGLKQEKEFFEWKCMDKLGGGQASDQKINKLTDMRLLPDQAVGGISTAAYEFYVHEGDNLQGPVHMMVAKDTGFPLRIEMNDPQGRGSIHLDYSFDKIGEIEIPACMAKAQQSGSGNAGTYVRRRGRWFRAGRPRRRWCSGE
jgi:hypothetical protein